MEHSAWNSKIMKTSKGCDTMAETISVDLFSWLQRLEKLAMANTSTRVSRPEEAGVKRLVAMAGERDSGETCR